MNRGRNGETCTAERRPVREASSPFLYGKWGQTGGNAEPGGETEARPEMTKVLVGEKTRIV